MQAFFKNVLLNSGELCHDHLFLMSRLHWCTCAAVAMVLMRKCTACRALATEVNNNKEEPICACHHA